MASTCIVVPCYNEEKRLDVAAFAQYLEQPSGVRFMLVNDGSKDGTLGVLQQLASRFPARVSVLDINPNQGKAEAVRRGMLQAMAAADVEYAGFWDADLATPLGAIEVFEPVLERLPRVDMVFGTRVQLLGRQIERKAARHYLGRVFATAASIVLSLPVYDTQCGAKLLRVNDHSRALFAAPFGSRWIFDVELVARYCRDRDGLTGIFELPLDRWADIGESKVRPVDFIRAFGEMLIIYRTYSRHEKRRRLLQFITSPMVRYAGAGAIGTGFHYLTLSMAVELLGARPVSGSVAGAVVGALVNYFLNYHLTFASKVSHRQTLPKFLAVATLGVVLSGLVVKLLTERAGAHYLIAQLSATLLVLATGFVLNKLWTFAQQT
jgi:dolichyl-phosphate beta-glucosyltransferase